MPSQTTNKKENKALKELRLSKINNFISILRESHPDIEKIFMNGGCYEFYRLLRCIESTIEPWGTDNHVFGRLGDILIDIRGFHDIKSQSGYPLINEPRILESAKSWKKENFR